MRYRIISAIIVLSLALGLLFYGSACKVEPHKTSGPSLRLAGTFTGNETCLLAGGQTNTISIAAINDSTISVSNLYGLGKSVTGTVLHDSCTIQPQICDTVIMQGLLILSGDTLNLSIIASSFGREDKCNAVLIKQ